MNPLESVSRYLNEHTTSSKDLWFIVLAIAAIAILWSGLALWDRFQANRKQKNLRLQTLFAELCEAHRIQPLESELLKHAAKRYGLSDAASLFFTPQALSALSEIGIPSDQIGELRRRLFGPDQFSEA